MFFKNKIRLTNSTIVAFETMQKAISFVLPEQSISLRHINIETRASSEKMIELTLQGEFICSLGKAKIGVNVHLEKMDKENSLWKVNPLSLIVVEMIGEADLPLRCELTEESSGTLCYYGQSKNKDLIPYNKFDWCEKDYGFKFH